MVRKAAEDFRGRAPGSSAGGSEGGGDSSVTMLRTSGAPSLMRSRRTCEARKTRTRRGRIGTSSPVFGLRPIRWPFWRAAKVPNEEILTEPSFSSDLRDLVDRVDQIGGLAARQADLLVDRFGELGPGDRLPRHGTEPSAALLEGKS